MSGPNSVNTTMGPAEWGLLIGLSVLWGGSFFFVGVAVDGLPPLTIVLLRVGLAALMLHVVCGLTGVRLPKDPRAWLALFVMAALNNVVPFCLIVWGRTQIASGLASILNATTPLFTVVVAHLLTRDEKLTTGRVAGVALGFGGVVLMIGPDALAGLGRDAAAQIAVLVASLSYAFASVFGRRFARMGMPPMAVATGQVTASTVMLAPLAAAVEHPWALPIPSGEIWVAVLGLALLSTALAYVVYFRILATAGATNLMLVTFLIPVTAILLGSAVLGERLEPVHFAGMAFIGLGLAAVDGRPLAAAHRLRDWTVRRGTGSMAARSPVTDCEEE